MPGWKARVKSIHVPCRRDSRALTGSVGVTVRPSWTASRYLLLDGRADDWLASTVQEMFAAETFEAAHGTKTQEKSMNFQL
jgi:hypothetical protein